MIVLLYSQLTVFYNSVFFFYIMWWTTTEDDLLQAAILKAAAHQGAPLAAMLSDLPPPRFCTRQLGVAIMGHPLPGSSATLGRGKTRWVSNLHLIFSLLHSYLINFCFFLRCPFNREEPVRTSFSLTRCITFHQHFRVLRDRLGLPPAILPAASTAHLQPTRKRAPFNVFTGRNNAHHYQQAYVRRSRHPYFFSLSFFAPNPIREKQSHSHQDRTDDIHRLPFFPLYW